MQLSYLENKKLNILVYCLQSGISSTWKISCDLKSHFKSNKTNVMKSLFSVRKVKNHWYWRPLTRETCFIMTPCGHARKTFGPESQIKQANKKTINFKIWQCSKFVLRPQSHKSLLLEALDKRRLFYHHSPLFLLFIFYQ